MATINTPQNQAVREPARQQQPLETGRRVGAASKKSDGVIGSKINKNERPGRKVNTRSRVTEDPPVIPMFPASNMLADMISNKTVGANRLIFVKSEIRERGMRGYQYYVPDQGFVFWSYRPMGFHQAH